MLWLAEWHFEQRIFDIINDSFPPRYTAKLENRSYAEGASKEGKTLAEFACDRQGKCRSGSLGAWSKAVVTIRLRNSTNSVIGAI